MFLFWARFEHDFLIQFFFFYLVKINKLIFFNLYVDVSWVMWHFYNILILPAATLAISVG